MALAVTIDATDQVSYLKDKSLSIKTTADASQGVADLTLIDPVVMPAVGDAISIDDGATNYHTGTVRSVGLSEYKDSVFVKVSSQDDYVASGVPDTAPFDLSDSPNYSTTYPYQNLALVTRNLDAAGEQTTGSCTVFQPGLAVNQNVHVTSTNYGLSAVEYYIQQTALKFDTPSSPRWEIAFGDPLVRLSDVVQEIDDGVITTTMISDGAISTPKIQAGSITADKLSATLLLASKIMTAEDGNRLEMDGDGFRAYNVDGDLLMNIPTDGSEVYVNAHLDALSLEIQDYLTMRGTHNVMAVGSKLTLQDSISSPSAPYVHGTWESSTFDAPTALTNYKISGGSYDPVGGADGATPCFVAVVTDLDTADKWVYEWKIADGTIDRTTKITLFEGLNPQAGGFVIRLGSYWYVCYSNLSGSTLYTQLDKIVRSSGSWSAGSDISSRFNFQTYYGYPIKTDGTSLFVAGNSAWGANMRVVEFDTSLAYVASTDLTDPSAPSGYPTFNYTTWSFEVADEGSGDYWYLGYDFTGTSGHSKRIYQFDPSDGSLVANTDFPMARSNDIYGFYWDGSNFKQATVSSGKPVIYTHTDWTYTTGAHKYYFGYAWYDSAGTTHETAIGALKSISIDRRQAVIIYTAIIPTGARTIPTLLGCMACCLHRSLQQEPSSCRGPSLAGIA